MRLMSFEFKISIVTQQIKPLQLASRLELAGLSCDVTLIKCKGQCFLTRKTGLHSTPICRTDFQDSWNIMGWFLIMRAIQEIEVAWQQLDLARLMPRRCVCPCACVYVCVCKFACDVYVNTGFNAVRGTEARHIQINSHILHHYRIRFCLRNICTCASTQTGWLLRSPNVFTARCNCEQTGIYKKMSCHRAKAVYFIFFRRH